MNCLNTLLSCIARSVRAATPAVIISCAAPLVSFGAHAQNLLADGGFEVPAVPVGSLSSFGVGQSISKWRVVGQPGNIALVSGAFVSGGYTYPARSGAQWLDLTGDSSNAPVGVQQTVSTTIGQTYDLSFYLGNITDGNGAGSSTVNVLVDGVNLMRATSFGGTSTMAWKQFRVSFVAARTSTAIAFINGDPPSDYACGLDAVVLEARCEGCISP